MIIRNLTDIKTIFLDNRTIKQTIFKNIFWTGLSDGITKFLKLGLIIYVARVLGATEYGKFTFAMSFISLFVVFFNLGLSDIIPREFSQEKKGKQEFFSLLSLEIILGLITLILILVSSFFITPDPEIRKVIWILAIFSSAGNFARVFKAFFTARQRMEYTSWGDILEVLIVLGLGLFVILNFPSIINLSYAYLFSSLASLVFLLVIFQFKIYPLKVLWDRAVWKNFLGMSWPLALASLFGTVYVYIDSVMMGYLGQITEAGWYSAAYKIIIPASFLMGIVSVGFYPVLSKFFKESKEKFQKVWNYQMELMVLLSVPSMAGGFILAPKIIEFIYGQSFAPSVLAFQILLIMVGTIYFSGPLGQALIISNHPKKYFWVTFLGAIVNIILNLILIPRFSLYGAAVATSITYVLILFMFLIFVSKFTPIQILTRQIFLSFIVAVFSSILMCFVISLPQIYNLNVFFVLLMGILIYFISFLALKRMARFIYNY